MGWLDVSRRGRGLVCSHTVIVKKKKQSPYDGAYNHQGATSRGPPPCSNALAASQRDSPTPGKPPQFSSIPNVARTRDVTVSSFSPLFSVFAVFARLSLSSLRATPSSSRYLGETLPLMSLLWAADNGQRDWLAIVISDIVSTISWISDYYIFLFYYRGNTRKRFTVQALSWKLRISVSCSSINSERIAIFFHFL